MCEENAQIQPCETGKGDLYWEAKRNAALAYRLRERTNCECISELAGELMQLDRDYKHLESAIKADPPYIPDSQKVIWPEQFKAMADYKTALKKRIIDLINTDN